MTTKTYKTKTGLTQYRPVLDAEELDDVMSDGSAGFCLACGAEAYGVEPDARKYTCDDCRAPKVYGMEELALMGLILIKEAA